MSSRKFYINKEDLAKSCLDFVHVAIVALNREGSITQYLLMNPAAINAVCFAKRIKNLLYPKNVQ